MIPLLKDESKPITLYLKKANRDVVFFSDDRFFEKPDKVVHNFDPYVYETYVRIRDAYARMQFHLQKLAKRRAK